MESVPDGALYLINDKDELCIINTPEDKDAALKIQFIHEMYCKHRMGGSTERAICISNLNFDDFLHVLHLLKLQIEEGGTPFINSCITYKSLLTEKWEMQIVPPAYLTYLEDMSTETLVRCMPTCSHLWLHDLRKLFMYRVIYIMNQKIHPDNFRSTWECLLTMSDYDLAVFKKNFREFTSASSTAPAPALATRARSHSF